MDIRVALEAAEKIKKSVNNFSKIERITNISECNTIKDLMDAHREVISKCNPFLNKIAKDLISSCDLVNIDAISARKEYIDTKTKEIEEREEINNLLKEIQEMEVIENIGQVEINQSEAKRIVNFIHTTNTNVEIDPTLEPFLEFPYEDAKSEKIYKKIMEVIFN